MENPISSQLALLEDAAKIINSQMSDIDTVEDRIELPDQIENLKRKTLLQIKRRYLEFFSHLEQFLTKKLKTEADQDFPFYVLHIRTLLEIYAHLLFLLSQDENKQMAFCVANLLIALSSAAKDSAIQNEKLFITYGNYHSKFKPFLDRENIDVPASIHDFSKKRLERLGLKYPSVKQMLSNKNIESHASETMKIFPTVSAEIYKTYEYFSNYIHGNHLSNIFYGKERFWILSKSTIIASLLIELVNIRINGYSRRKEFEDWLKSVDANAESFVLAWRVYEPQRKEITP